MNSNDVIILGGTGYIGSNVSQYLVKKGYHVRALGSGDLNLVDAESAKQLAGYLQIPSHLLICSAITRTSEDSTDSCFLNIRQVEHIIKACEAQQPVSVCFLSASDVYGHAGRMVDESKPLNPQNKYGHYKVFAENMLTECLKNICPVQVVRFSGVFGGVADNSSLIYRFCNAVLTQKNITLMNNGENFRDFLPVEILAEVIETLLSNNESGPINASIGQDITIKGLVELIVDTLQLEAKIEYKPEKTLRDFDLSLSNKKLKHLIPDLDSATLRTLLVIYIQRFKQHSIDKENHQ